MDIAIPELNEILHKLDSIEKLVIDNRMTQEFYNDEQCWALKGGMALSTYRSEPYYQVKGGKPDAKVGGRKVWHRDSVIEWLSLADEDLEAYHKKYKTGLKRRCELQKNR